MTQAEKLRRHLDYWQGKAQKRPLLCFRIGTVFFSRAFAANDRLLQVKRPVDPREIAVDDYLADYERMYEESQALEQDAFFCAEPCAGFPWMEGIFGSRIVGEENGFVAQKVLDDLGPVIDFSLTPDNPWFRKYMEFSERLARLSGGRFPVGQPILRGVSDTVGSLLGQTELIYAMIDEPERVKRAFGAVVKAHREITRAQQAAIPAFMDGRSIGFYHLWAPGSAIWFQEDLAALMSPTQFDEFLKDTANAVIDGYDYSLVHLHPASFYHLDGLLGVPKLTAIQINKDNGSTLDELLPVCRRVLSAGKRLALGMGSFSKRDIRRIYDELPHNSLCLNIICDTFAQAVELREYIESLQW